LAFTYQVNISLIVNDDEAEQCVRSLHSAFFESDVSELDGKCVSDNGPVQLRSEE
jgi:aspartate kinase